MQMLKLNKKTSYDIEFLTFGFLPNLGIIKRIFSYQVYLESFSVRYKNVINKIFSED